MTIPEKRNQSVLYLGEVHINQEKLGNGGAIGERVVGDGFRVDVQETSGPPQLPRVVSVQHVAPHDAVVLFFASLLPVDGGRVEVEVDTDPTGYSCQLATKLGVAGPLAQKYLLLVRIVRGSWFNRDSLTPHSMACRRVREGAVKSPIFFNARWAVFLYTNAPFHSFLDSSSGSSIMSTVVRNL